MISNWVTTLTRSVLYESYMCELNSGWRKGFSLTAANYDLSMKLNEKACKVLNFMKASIICQL